MDSAGNWFKIASLLFAAASVGIGARNILPTPTAEPHRLPQVAADAQPIPETPQLRRLPPVSPDNGYGVQLASHQTTTAAL
ncbi:MAG: hypothetical protein KDA62_21990, partial [Planctomycetales bacterium]|nr:hypothetical protein [Planctomycetales bacterium]